MEATTSLMVGGIVVIGGRWAEGKPFDLKVGVGLGVAVILMSIMANWVPELAEPLAMLFLVGALLVYGIPLFQGLVKK